MYNFGTYPLRLVPNQLAICQLIFGTDWQSFVGANQHEIPSAKDCQIVISTFHAGLTRPFLSGRLPLYGETSC